MIYIKGEETFIPGILEKTLLAIKISSKNFTYDYIVRTNISTLVNYIKLIGKANA